MSRRPINMRLPEELLARVDAARGDVSRTRFVERALEAALENEQGPKPASRGDSGGAATDGGTNPSVPARSRASNPKPLVSKSEYRSFQRGER